MLSQQSKKDIKRKLSTIYSIDYSKKKLNIYADEIFSVINKYNKFGIKRKKIIISEKTSALICYGDSLLDGNKEKTLKIIDQILKGESLKPGSYRGRLNSEPENNRKTLIETKNA